VRISAIILSCYFRNTDYTEFCTVAVIISVNKLPVACIIFSINTNSKRHVFLDSVCVSESNLVEQYQCAVHFI